jgi:hypothetical protein
MSWQTQLADKPLFPDLLWSRPQNKRQAGKLLIVGGQAQEFSHVAASYQDAQKAGAGTIKVILPVSLSKLAAAVPDVQFAPANQSGSFARSALAELLDASQWANGVLLAGDFGKNSETTATLDSLLAKIEKPVTINEDALQSIDTGFKQLMDRDVDLILGFKTLQKLGGEAGLEKPFVSTMPSVALAERLSELSKTAAANIVAVSEGHIWVASRGQVTSTKSDQADLTRLSGYCAVWHMQNLAKPLEAITTACYQLAKPRNG